MIETFHEFIGQDTPHIAWWQMCSRALIIFVYAVLLYRLVPRRSLSDLSPLDIVLTVVLGSSLSRALTGNAALLPTLIACALLVAFYSGLTALAPRSIWISKLMKGRPIRIIHDGEVDWPAVRRAQLGENDITEHLRLNGLRSADQVEEAYLERNGKFSVIKKGSQ